MPEEATLLRLAERRPGPQLADASDVVQQSGAEDEIGAKPWVELGRLAAQCRDTDGVLEQPPGVAVVAVRTGRGERSECGPDLRVSDEPSDDRRQSRMRDLLGEKLEEPVQLVRIAPERRGERDRIRVIGGLQCADLKLEPPSEALDAAEDPHRVPFAESPVEELDVAPDPSFDATARVGELEREERRTRPRPPALFLRDREHAFDDPVLGEIGDRGHGRSV